MGSVLGCANCTDDKRDLSEKQKRYDSHQASMLVMIRRNPPRTVPDPSTRPPVVRVLNFLRLYPVFAESLARLLRCTPAI